MSRRPFRMPSLHLQTLEDRTNPSPAVRAGYVFDGPDYDANPPATGALATPASPGVAVGPSHIVNITNNQIQFRTIPSGSAMTTDLDAFFLPGFAGTPVVWSFARATYDQAAQRFVVIAAARATSSQESKIFLAASDDLNPLGTWYKKFIPANLDTIGSANYASDLGLGLDEEAIYITSSHNNFSNNVYRDARVHIVNKAQLYGNTATSITAYDPSPAGQEAAYRYLAPAQIFGTPPTGTTGTYFVSYNGVAGGADFAVVTRVANPLGSATFSPTTLNVGDIDQGGLLPDAPQSGTATGIETGDREVGNAVWRNNHLYFASTVNPVAGADAGQATAHWFNVDTTAATPTLTDQGDISGTSGLSTFLPAVSVDIDGNLAVAYSGSEAGDFVKGYYAARLATDPAGTIQAQVEINPAPTPENTYINLDGTVNLWGPSAAIGLDPAGRGFYAYSAFATNPATTGPANNRGRWATKGVGFSFNWSPEVVPGGLSPILSANEDDPPAELDLDPAFKDYEDQEQTDPALPLEFALVANSNPGLVTVQHIDNLGQPSRDKFRLTFAPNANGSTVLTFQAIDSGGAVGTFSITVSIAAQPDAPIAVNDSYSTTEDTPLVRPLATGVLSNDSDPDNEAITAVLTSAPLFGSLDLNADGSFTYTPAPNYSGPDSFKYVVKDGTTPTPLTSNEATVSITVTAVNDAPVADPDGPYAAVEDTTLNVSAANGVLANDSDVDSPTFTAVLLTQGSKGTVTLAANGSFQYVPNPNANGTDTFTYRATDGSAFSPPATVTIQIAPVDDAPIATNDSYSTPEDTTLTRPAATGILANDQEFDGQSLTITKLSDPTHGILTLNLTDGSFTYVPDPDYFGPDSFTYTVSDGTSAPSNVATVSINVTAVNDAPVAVDDAYTTREDQTLVVPAPGVRNNDRDVDGTVPTVSVVADPAHGSLVLSATGAFTYTPATDYFGPDSFTYKLNDGTADSNVATVRLNVTPVQDAPVAVDDGPVSVPGKPVKINVLANDSDVDRDRLSVQSFTAPTKGSVTRSGTQLLYTPRAGATGADSFTYRVSDGHGNSDTATVTLNLTDTVAPKVTAVRLYYGPNAYVDLKSIGRSVLPWEHVSRVDVVFSEAVNVTGPDLTLASSGGAAVSTTFGGFNATTRTATWTFADLGASRFNLQVAGTIADPSANQIGSTWARTFGVLPGDFDGNGRVNAVDVSGVKGQKGKANAYADINGDGVVNDLDTARVSANLGDHL